MRRPVNRQGIAESESSLMYSIPAERSDSVIREVPIGSPPITAGGENILPFYTFDGTAPNRPLIAAEVYDINPGDWPEALTGTLGGLLDDPALHARTASEEWGVDLVALKLVGTDPNGEGRSPAEAAATAREVADAAGLPLLVYGSENIDRDGEVIAAVTAALAGRQSAVGPALEENYREIAEAALSGSQIVIAKTPIDVNLAKQLNILLNNLGVELDRILIDPNTGALGYGLEYTYSVMERLKLAALRQDDAMTQMPMVADVGTEAWKAKEAKAPAKEEPQWGDERMRGILWEVITAVTLILAGANIVIMRHPEAIRTVRKLIDAFGTGLQGEE